MTSTQQRLLLQLAAVGRKATRGRGSLRQQIGVGAKLVAAFRRQRKAAAIVVDHARPPRGEIGPRVLPPVPFFGPPIPAATPGIAGTIVADAVGGAVGDLADTILPGAGSFVGSAVTGALDSLFTPGLSGGVTPAEALAIYTAGAGLSTGSTILAQQSALTRIEGTTGTAQKLINGEWVTVGRLAPSRTLTDPEFAD